MAHVLTLEDKTGRHSMVVEWITRWDVRFDALKKRQVTVVHFYKGPPRELIGDFDEQVKEAVRNTAFKGIR